MFNKLVRLFADLIEAPVFYKDSLTLCLKREGSINGWPAYAESFGDKNTEKIWSSETVRKIPLEIQKIGRRKLRMIHNSQDVVDLRIPPSNRLEKLKGKLRNFHSIRINDQWRIIFIWDNNNAEQVQIIDYHK